MPTFISALNGNYISLKRAATLIAEESPELTFNQVMDTLLHAAFTDEFRHAYYARPDGPPDEEGLPLMQIGAPRRSPTEPELPRREAPQEYYAVVAATVGELLSERKALPGKPEQWDEFLQFPRDTKAFLHMLAHMPYTAFPPVGQAMLCDILIAKANLRNWMAFKGYAIPRFLSGDISIPEAAPNPPATDASAVALDLNRGRPEKAAWGSVRAFARKIHSESPKKAHKAIAYEAREKAKAEFPENDLPSLKSIAGRMKSLLSPGA